MHISNNFNADECTVIQAAQIALKQWKNHKIVSPATKNASGVTEIWQEYLKNNNRYEKEKSISKTTKERIDMIDTFSMTAYELKVSKNNPGHEFYKDIFKIFVYNKKSENKKKIKKLIFITTERKFKDKSLPKFIMECSDSSLGFTIAISDIIVNS